MTGPRPVALVGAGHLACAVVTGLGRPVRISDNGSGRARELAAEHGGTAGPTADIACDAIVLLAHPVGALDDVAAAVDGRAACVVSLLSGVPTETVRTAYPKTPVVRATVTAAAAQRAGVVTWPRRHDLPPELAAEVGSLLGSLGTLHEVDESVMTPLIALAGVAPAYYALLVEAQVDAAIAVGVPADLASRAAVDTAAACIGLLAARHGDTVGVRRSVTTPGGRTARGLAVLESSGLRGTFVAAARAVVQNGATS